MIRDLFDDLTSGDWTRSVTAFLLLLALCAVLLMVGFGCFYAVDSSFLPKREGVAVVTAHSHSLPYTTTSIAPVGKVMVPITTSHPEEWTLV